MDYYKVKCCSYRRETELPALKIPEKDGGKEKGKKEEKKAKAGSRKKKKQRDEKADLETG